MIEECPGEVNTSTEGLDLSRVHPATSLRGLQQSNVVDILRERVSEMQEESPDVQLLLGHFREGLRLGVVPEVVVVLEQLQQEHCHERSEKLFLLGDLVLVTDEVEGVDQVVLPVLAVSCGSCRIIVLLQLLLQAPDVLEPEPGQEPEGEGGVDVEPGGDENGVSPALVLVVGGESGVPALHATEADGGAERAGDDGLDLGQALLAVGPEPLRVEGPGDGGLPQQCRPHRNVLRGLHKPPPSLLVPH